MNQRRKRRARPLEPGQRTIRALVTLSVLEGAELEGTIEVDSVREVESTLDCWFTDEVLCLFAESHLEVVSEAGLALEEAVDRTERARQERLASEYVAIGRLDETLVEAETFLCAPVDPFDATANLYLFERQSQNTSPLSVGQWLDDRIAVYRERLREGSEEERQRAEATPGELQLALYRPDLVPSRETDKKVRHSKFGVGTVLDERGPEEAKKYKIKFDDEIRTILAEFVEPV